MQTLERLEVATNNFAIQMKTITDRTTEIESKVGCHSTQITETWEEVSSLQNKIQENQETTSNTVTKLELDAAEKSRQLTKVEEEIAMLKKTVHERHEKINSLIQAKDDQAQDSKKTIAEMNKLVDQQKIQVESFKSTAKNLKREVKKDTEDQILQVKKDIDYTTLKGQAVRKRKNIVIIGLPELAGQSSYSLAIKFFKNRLRLNKLDIDVAYRMGPAPPENSHYIRPLVVEFTRVSDRNAVWRKRNDILPPSQDTGEKNNEDPTDHQPQPYQQNIKIQADLPKQLRDNINTLYRVFKAATHIPQFQSASIKDYALHLNGEVYSAQQLELLPESIRPSSLPTHRSDTALVFFSRFCPLSNHYPSTFTVEGKTFNNVEQYLAYRKAKTSNQDTLITKALASKDPVEAKSILNTLRNDHREEWERDRQEIITTALKAKFKQNKVLMDFLCNTKDLLLGEASKDPCWGIGMTLEDQEVTINSKWNKNGNLLGKTLMAIRTDLNPKNPSKNKKQTK